MTTYEPSTDDVELLADRFDRDPRIRGVVDFIQRFRKTLATVALEALAGRLLPPGGETHVEVGQQMFDRGVFPLTDLLRETFGWTGTHRRTVTTWSDGSTHTSAWEATE